MDPCINNISLFHQSICSTSSFRLDENTNGTICYGTAAREYVSERRGLFIGMFHLKMRKKLECNQLVMISSIRRDTCFESKLNI